MVADIMQGNIGQDGGNKNSAGTRHPYGTQFGLILVTLVSALSLPVEMYTRRGFGLRYVGVPIIIGGWLFMLGLFWISVFTSNPFGQASGPGVVGLLDWLYILVAVGIAAWWAFQAKQKEKQGEELHTFFKGQSYLSALGPLNLNNDRLQRFVEPVVIVLAGWLLDQVTPGLLGKLIIAGGVALLIKEAIRYQAARTQYLNARDARIEAKAMAFLMKDGGWYKANANPKRSLAYGGFTAQILTAPKDDEEKRMIADSVAAALPAEPDGEGPVSDFHRFRDAQLAADDPARPSNA